MNDLRQWMDARMDAHAEELAEINSEEVLQRGVGGFGMQQRAIALLTTIKAALFPSIYENGAVTDKHLTALGQERLFASAEQLLGIARDVLPACCDRENPCAPEECQRRAEDLTRRFMEALPGIRRVLTTDIRAAYEGDPAARSTEASSRPSFTRVRGRSFPSP